MVAPHHCFFVKIAPLQPAALRNSYYPPTLDTFCLYCSELPSKGTLILFATLNSGNRAALLLRARFLLFSFAVLNSTMRHFVVKKIAVTR